MKPDADSDTSDQLVPEADVLIEASSSAAYGAPVATGDILLVDDDPQVLETLSAILARDGHRVVTATGLPSAKALLDDRRFDVLIVDLGLGEHNGLDVLRLARERDDELIGIVVTGYASLESAIQALKGGAFSYLLKPCDLADLRQAIAAGLQRRLVAETTRLAAQAAQDRSARRAAQRATRRVARLQELTAQLSMSLATEDVLDRIVRSAVELLECPTAGVFVTRPGDADFHLAASQGLDQNQVERLTRTGSLAGHAAQQRTTIAVNDVRRQRDIQLPALVGGKRVGGLAVAPIMTHTEVLGVIEVYEPRTHRWQSDELELLGALASAAAIALENARLYEATQQAVLIRDHVLGTVSHDLKNPIAAINGRVQLLQHHLARDATLSKRPDIGDELELVRRLTIRMSEFLDELVDTVRLGIGEEVELRLVRTDLVEVVREAIDMLEGTASPEHDIAVSAPHAVVGRWDRARVQRAVLNLLNNALKYSPQGGRVDVAAEQDGDAALLRVSDHGIGIGAEDLDRIFQPFQRGSNVGLIPGSGLGLASVRRIVALHGGTVSVKSSPGGGATFVVRLPLTAG